MEKTAADYIGEGIAHYHACHLEEALQAYDLAISKDPTYGEAYFRKAYLFDTMKKDPDSVIEFYNKAISNGFNKWNAYYNLGVKLNSIGRTEEAVEAYDKSLALQEQADCYENKGNALMALGRIEEAVECYLKSLQVNPRNWTVHPRLGGLYDYLGQSEEAMRYFNLCLEANPEDFRSNLRKGDLLSKCGRYQEAIECYRVIDKGSETTDPQLNYAMGTAYKAIGVEEKAIEHFKRALKMEPTNSFDFLERGRCFYMLGDKEEAFGDLRKAKQMLETSKVTMLLPGYVELVKKALKLMFEVEEIADEAEEVISYLEKGDTNIEKIVNSIQTLKQASIDQIMLHLNNSKPGEDNEHLNELIRRKDELIKHLKVVRVKKPVGKSAAEYVTEGLQMSNRGNKQKALELYELAIAADPTYGEAYFRKAFLLDQTKKDGEVVIALYQKGLDNGYSTWIVYYNMGAKYNSLGRREEAVKAHDASLALHEDTDCYENKGNALMALGRIEESVACYLESLRMNPQNWTVHPRLGGLYEYLGMPVEAIKYFNLKLENNPMDYRSNLRKGDLLAKSGKYIEALEYYKKIDSNSAVAIAQLNYSMGAAYMALGMEKEAMVHFGRAERMEPENALDFLEKGRCFYMLGKKAQAMENMRKAGELLDSDKVTMLLPGYVELIRNTLKLMLEAEESGYKVVEQISGAKGGQEEEEANRLNEDFIKLTEGLNDKST